MAVAMPRTDLPARVTGAPPRSLKESVGVDDEVRRSRGHVALDRDLPAGAERDDRVARPGDAGAEVESARQRRGSPGGIDAQVAGTGRRDNGQVDDDGR